MCRYRGYTSQLCNVASVAVRLLHTQILMLSFEGRDVSGYCSSRSIPKVDRLQESLGKRQVNTALPKPGKLSSSTPAIVVVQKSRMEFPTCAYHQFKPQRWPDQRLGSATNLSSVHASLQILQATTALVQLAQHPTFAPLLTAKTCIPMRLSCLSTEMSDI